MTLLLIRILQEGGGGAAIPDAGIRISVWFIGMFLLAVGGALVYLRLRELDQDGESGDQGNVDR
jgi:hypothetical protein